MPSSNWFDRVRLSALFADSNLPRRKRRQSHCDRTACVVESLESRIYLHGVHAGDDLVAPYILNGQPTNAFPSVGIVGDFDADGNPRGFCTGTLINATHVLTAAHCGEGVADTNGMFQLADGRVFRTSRVFVHPNYNTRTLENDLAIYRLSTPVTGVTPSELFRGTPRVGDTLTLVGFGGVGTGATGGDGSFGVKHVGTTAIDGVETNRITWNFDNEDESSTNPGDSGGPAYLTVNGELFLAGVTSGGTTANGAIPTIAFDVRVDAYASWIDGIAGTSPPQSGGDDHSNSAFGATSLSIPDDRQGTLEIPNDQDWFRFDALVDQRYFFQTMDLTHPNTTLSLIDRNGVTVLESDSDSASDGGALIEWEANATGTFYLRVTSSAPGNPAQIGGYMLTLGEAEAADTPTLLTPQGTIVDTTPTFDWTPAIDAVRYELWVIDVTDGGTAIHNTDILETHYTDPMPLEAGHSYRAQVRGIAANGVATEFSEVSHFEIAEVQVLVPFLESPGTTVADTTPSFRWTAADGALRYEIWVNDLTTGQSAVIRDANVRATTFTPTAPLVAGHQYIWTVRGIHMSGIAGDYAAHARFTVTSDVGVPTLEAPIGIEASTTPLFNWSDVPGAVRYDLWVNNLTTGQSAVIRETTLTQSQYQPLNGLTPGHDYIWTARAFDSNGIAGDFARAKTFRAPSNVQQPSITAPTGRINATSPVFQWSEVANADHYDIWVNNLTDGISGVIRQNVNTNSFTPSTPLPGGKSYIWTVRAVDSGGNVSLWADHNTFIIDATIGTPTLKGPTDTVGTATPTFSWDPVSAVGTPMYDLWVNDLTTGESGVIRERTLTTTSFKATNLVFGHSYIWTVRAIHPSGVPGEFAAHKTFRIAPDQPVLAGPSGDNASSTPTFTWSAVTGAVSYTLYVADRGIDFDSNTQVIFQRNLTTTSFTSPISLISGHTYQWWVRAKNDNGVEGRWSSPQTFKVASSSSGTGSLDDVANENSENETGKIGAVSEDRVDERDEVFANFENAEGVFAVLYRDEEAPHPSVPST